MTHNMIKRFRVGPLVAIVSALGGIAAQAPVAAEPLPYGPDTCIQGFVWREARVGDTVCVPPAVRDRTLQENSTAPERWEPNGAYGPHTCKSGLVWREAFDGDSVCVTPEIRQEAWNDNSDAQSRKAANVPLPTPGSKPSDPARDCSRICPGTA